MPGDIPNTYVQYLGTGGVNQYGIASYQYYWPYVYPTQMTQCPKCGYCPQCGQQKSQESK